jgi:hypothetical protein
VTRFGSDSNLARNLFYQLVESARTVEGAESSELVLDSCGEVFSLKPTCA